MGLLSHLQNIFNMKADAALNAAEEPGQVFDYSYTKQLEQLQQLRRAIAEVVTNEKHIELLVAQVEVRSVNTNCVGEVYDQEVARSGTMALCSSSLTSVS